MYRILADIKDLRKQERRKTEEKFRMETTIPVYKRKNQDKLLITKKKRKE